MFMAYTLKEIHDHDNSGKMVLIPSGSIISVLRTDDDIHIGELAGASFDIFPDEYVKLTGKQSKFSH